MNEPAQGRVSAGESLRALRKARRLSAQSLAAEAGISPTTLSHLENDQISQPDRETLEAILSILDHGRELSASERDGVLAPFGYRDGSRLPNAQDIAQALTAWEPYAHLTLPSYLVDYAQRVHAWNALALGFLGADTLQTRSQWTVFDIAFSDDFQGAVVVENRDVFMREFVEMVKREFVPFTGEAWLKECLEAAWAKYPEFRRLWDAIPDETLTPVSLRTLGPVSFSIGERRGLRFKIVGTDLVSDPRFRVVQYIPFDEETALRCFALFQPPPAS